jgi:glyoxylase-like metal-dependent hydrolase (beta-lactamase superfamily II)
MHETIAPDTTLIDLSYHQQSSLIASCALCGPDGVALIDPGPTCALSALRLGLERIGASVADVRSILLTHIHLDHAGASGALVRENPAIRVFVHERGAKHLVDPTRLIESARRIYGPALDTIWGEFAAVPPANVVSLGGSEDVTVGGRTLAVAYTPGHANHHVSYLDSTTGLAFVGDIGGVRIGNAPLVLPTTPPPDIDLARWSSSLARIREWHPDRLFLTHFGVAENLDDHLSQLESHLGDWAARVRASLGTALTDEDRATQFATGVVTELQRSVPEVASLYEWASGPEDSWYGLARYWRKHHNIS